MDRTLKATLLSALVLPGMGQFYLRRVARGCLFMLPTLVAVYFFATNIFARAQQIADQILDGRLPMNPLVIAERLHQTNPNDALMNWCAAVMVLCWVLSIADAWFIGHPAAPRSATTKGSP